MAERHQLAEPEAEHFERHGRRARQRPELERHAARPGVGQHQRGAGGARRGAIEERRDRGVERRAVGHRSAQRSAGEDGFGQRHGMELAQLERPRAALEGGEAQLAPRHRRHHGRHREGRQPEGPVNPRR